GARSWRAARIKPAHRRYWRRLRQLIQALLEELAIRLRIRKLVGAGARQARQQRHDGSQSAERRDGADIPVSAHCSPKKHQWLRAPAIRPRVPRHMILRALRRSSAPYSPSGVFVAAWPACNMRLYLLEIV